VKSPAELAYTRRAAELADAALLAMIETAKPGVLDGTITAAGLSVILSGGGDMPPDGPIVNSGPRAVYGRSVGGGHEIEAQDQILIEFASTFARYNACIERTVVVGTPHSRQVAMFDACRDALLAMTAAARPGRPIGEIDDEHRRVLDDAGFGSHRYGACGYSLGNTYRPSWMDAPPMIFSGNALIAEPGMVFFPHVMLGDTKLRLVAGLGYTIVITDTGCEVLSQLPLELPVRA
jgi:Xaa-Pro dipeptidase